MTEPVQVPRATTPPTIVFALFCFVFAIVCPFVGGIMAERSPGEGLHAIGVILPWLLAGGVAGILGVICTLVGSWNSPRTAPTVIAIVLALLFALLFTLLLGAALH